MTTSSLGSSPTGEVFGRSEARALHGSGGTRRASSHVCAAPIGVSQLLNRARSELLLAETSADPGERFRRAHLAALRAAAAVVDGGIRRPARGRPRSAWELLEREAPELRPWAAFFASGARLRAAVEAGRDPGVSPEQADDLVTMARRFLDVVEERPAAWAS